MQLKALDIALTTGSPAPHSAGGIEGVGYIASRVGLWIIAFNGLRAP